MRFMGWLLAATVTLGLSGQVQAAAAGGATVGRVETGRTLRPFADEADLQRWVAKLRAKAERERRAQERARAHSFTASNGNPKPLPAPPLQVPAPVMANAASSDLDKIEVTGERINDDAITHVQTEGVDEGDIVKKRGDFLIVLRRGRLFSVRIGGDALTPVSAIDAYAPGVDPKGAWYDEMLVSDRTVVVIGYSYEREGTEVGVFDLAPDGRLSYRDTYQLRSNDYYSASNYASRLVGHKLVFYTPSEIDSDDPDPAQFLPALRHWHAGATPAEFRRILPATRIYRTRAGLDLDEDLALHTVAVCDLDAPLMQCQATAVLGPAGRVFYVSEDAVYIWTTPWDPSGPNQSAVFRMPLDGSAPSGLQVSGSPIDQMSFLQRDGHLNVLVGSEANGEAMWAAHGRAGELALLRVPLQRFGDGSTAAAKAAYRALPQVDQDAGDLQNRFIGDWLVYGTGKRWGRASAHPAPVQALRFADDGPVQKLRPGHPVVRIEALGSNAVLVGPSGRDLRFTSVRLGERAEPIGAYVQHDAAQGDERTHGFFYRQTAPDEGIAGLPILRAEASGQQAAVLYLRNARLRLRPMGALESRQDHRADDGCRASCVDWYGNARPIFAGDRVFALMGYELVEGRVGGERIVERRRIDFSPAPPASR